jgi:hypothetical protein
VGVAAIQSRLTLLAQDGTEGSDNVLEFVEFCVYRVGEGEGGSTGSNLERLIDGELLEPISAFDAEPGVCQRADVARLDEPPLAEEF